MLQIYLQPAKPRLETGRLLLIRTPLVPHQLPHLLLTVLLGTAGPCVAWVVATVC
jgi:hypothetical protein